MHAFVRLVFKGFGKVPTAPRPEAAALVLLDAVRLGRVRPHGRACRVLEGAAGLRALEAREGRRVALDVLRLVPQQPAPRSQAPA